MESKRSHTRVAKVKSIVAASRPLKGKRKATLPDELEVKQNSVAPVQLKFSTGQKRQHLERNSIALRSVVRMLPPPDLESDMDLEEGSMSIARCLVDPGQIYRFRLSVIQATVATNGAGVLSGTQTFNPTAITEFASLSALFNQVRIVHARMYWSNQNPHSDGYATGPNKYPLPIGCDLGLTATTPGSQQVVWDCPNTLVVNLASPKTYVLDAKIDPSLTDFALTSSPVPGPFAGCYGQFQWYQGGLAVSTAYASLYFEGVYEFRSRT